MSEDLKRAIEIIHYKNIHNLGNEIKDITGITPSDKLMEEAITYYDTLIGNNPW